MVDKLLPAFYINITGRCNMHCEYCPPGGEDTTDGEGVLPMSKLLSIIEVVTRTPIITYRITGGEPMLYPRRVFRLLELLNQQGITSIILNTNGFNLARHAERLHQFKLLKLKVSLDSLDPEHFSNITGTPFLKNVLKGIEAAVHASLPLELNMVVYKHTVDDLDDMIEYCASVNVSLKLLDLWLYDNCPGASKFGSDVWSKMRVEQRELVPALSARFGTPEKFKLSNGRGIPMLQFRITESATLTLTDSSEGTTFGRVCKNCPLFPCQLGLFYLSLSSTGFLSPCRLRPDLNRPMIGLGQDAIDSCLREVLDYYQEPFFLRNDKFSPVHKRLV